LKDLGLERYLFTMTNTDLTSDLTIDRSCDRCHGSGRIHSTWDVDEGPDGRECSRCKGRGTFPGLDLTKIIDALFTKKGKSRSFRKSFPSKLDHFGDLFGARCYYVWRLARFHGGADVTLPMTADMVTRGDPFKKELDALADLVANRVYGTNLAAAYRWGGLLGFAPAPLQGLPSSAYESGPVVMDGEKPWWEAAELI
jgi:hypothetical protein